MKPHLLRCQGFAVANYSFTLGRLAAGASSTFAQLGLNLRMRKDFDMAFMGRVWKFGDDVSTDVIFPGKYVYTIQSPQEMATHAMEGINPQFSCQVKKNDIIVAGKNFGCGSSREQAATCLKYAEVGAVVAKSFGRIFFRNAINMGLPLVQCPEAVDVIEEGERINVDYITGTVSCTVGTYEFTPTPEFVLDIMRDGGLIAHTKKKFVQP